eukprot:40027-Lingulodinium_polyedra.AAC.1
MARSNRPSATATDRTPHASRTPREHQNWRAHATREACDLRPAVAADGHLDRIITHGFKNRAQRR